jgi:hypothetical protein
MGNDNDKCHAHINFLYVFIIILLLLLFILTAYGFIPGGNGTTIRHNTQTRHITHNNTTIKRNTVRLGR